MTVPVEDEETPRPAQMLGRVAKVFIAAMVLMLGLIVLWYLSSLLGSHFLRIVVGFALALGALSLGVTYFRQVANPPPPDPVPTEVHARLRLAYLCEMCGLELAVVKVAKDRPPKHCGEAMALIRRPGGRPDEAPEPDPGPSSGREALTQEPPTQESLPQDLEPGAPV